MARGNQLTYRRPGGVTLLALLQFIGAALLLLLAAVSTAAVLFSSTTEAGGLIVAATILGAIGALELVCAIGLWKLKGYGRTIQLVFSWIGLIGFPIGTIISIFILVYLNKPGIKILFSGKPVARLTADEAAQVAAVGDGSLAFALAAVALVFVCVIIIAVLAAIAVPGLLRARMSGNEAAAIGSLHRINTAQQRYSQRCRGYAPSLRELKDSDGSLFNVLTSEATVTVGGYSVTMEPSSSAVLAPNPPPGCAGAVTEYFAHADPLTYGSTGMRYFATDTTGTIFQDRARAITDPIAAFATPVQ